MALTDSKAQKLKAIQNAMKNLEKSLKKEGVVQRLGDKEFVPIPSISSGSLMFDLALGVGGLPKGRIIEFFGAESSGKTLCALKAMGECQKAGGIVAFVDMEHTFDPTFAAKLGVEWEDVIFSQPDHLQDAFKIIDALIDSGGIDLIVLDSVAALVPQEELDGEVGKRTIGLVAGYMSQFLRRITGKTAKTGCSVIFINQIRDAVGVMYGDPTTTPGGKALKFYCSVRVRVSKVGSSTVTTKIGTDDVPIGHAIRTTVVKNKVAAPFRKAEFMVYYDGRPTDKIAELAQVALSRGLIPKYDAKGNLSATGRTYKWESEPNFIATKKDDVAIELRKYPKMQEELLEVIKKFMEDPTIAQEQDKFDGDLTDEEFEEELKKEVTNAENEAEEESSWEEL
jgi:recombination protein RecA